MKLATIPLFNKQRPVIISGPCSAESEEQLIETCTLLAKTKKVDLLRVGIWKPRTRPNNFEGVGEIGLAWMKKVKTLTHIPVSVEVANFNHVFQAVKHGIDVLWIGARTTVNPFSVQEIAEALKGTNATVLIKNPINADIELWVGAVERLYGAGIKKLGLIHRGFSHYGQNIYRNDPKWHIALEMKRRFPDLPILCDPSHICGSKELIAHVSQQAMDLDYDGLMIESHRDPTQALSDKKQQLTPNELEKLLDHLIIRKSSIEDIELSEKLGELRRQIDTFDHDIIKLIGQRMNISEVIGEIKQKKGVTILQTKRWDEVIDKANKIGEKLGLSKLFMNKYMNAIHEESIEHQNKIMNE